MSDSDPPPSTPPPSGRSVRPMSGLLASGWMFGVVFVQSLLLVLVLGLRPDAQTDLVSGFACQTIAYLLGLFLILRVHAPATSVRAVLGARKTHPGFYPIAILLAAALTPPIDALFEVMLRRYPDSKEAGGRISDLLANASTPKLIAFGAIIMVIGPILEEIFFRGALFNPIERAYPASRSIAVGITAFLFAAAHLDHQELIPLALLGLALGFLRQQSGSLIPPILLHMSFNGVGFYAILTTAPSASATTSPSRLILAGTSAAALLLLGLAHLISTRSEAAANAQELDRQ
jgi:uncharacterized protein